MIKKLISIFVVTSILGYFSEIIFNVLVHGEIVSRGNNFGPYFQIYGIGSILIYYCYKKINCNMVTFYFLMVLLCTALELATYYLIKFFFGIEYWNYADDFLNLFGVINTINSILFGFGAIIFVKYLLPIIEQLNENKYFIYAVMVIFGIIIVDTIIIN